MMRSRAMLRTILLLAAMNLLAIPAAVNAAEAAPEVEKFFKAYVEAFNAGDAAKIAGMWTEDAEWTDDATGDHTTGRETVQSDFTELFATHPGAKLSGGLEHAKQVAPGVVCIEGQAIVTLPGEEPTVNTFSAVLVSQAGTWRLASVHDTVPPSAGGPYAKLKELEFLVGEWRDDGGEAEVKTSFRWAADGAFLVRSYSIAKDGEETTGTQIIGWDPRNRSMRSWNFVSDGSFGEGDWSRSGDEWIGRMSQVLTDGATASATQVIRLVDKDTLEVETVAQEIDGEPQPSSPPVRVVRVPAPAAEVQTQGGAQ